MAKKEETPNMIEQFADFKENKNIDQVTLIGVLEYSFRKVLTDKFRGAENFDVICNPENGDVQILHNLEIVPDGEVEDPNRQISLSDARADNDPDAEVGEEHIKEIEFAKFGRRAIVTLRQILQGRILEIQNEAKYAKFKALEGELVSGEVYQIWNRETLLMDEKNELILPKSESIPGDFFRKGERIRAIVKGVENPANPRVIVSRTSPLFLRRLFELEVPEIHDGLISIHDVARIPGERAKVSVESFDDRIDPVGACVGVKGSRIHGIVRELHNENIDVINYTSNPSLYIQRALSPAKISSIRLDEETKKAEVFLSPDQVSLAIGRAGSNIKLASMLTGYEIDVYRESDAGYEDDIYLDEFKDEIDAWVIDSLKNMGCNTARQVLNTPRQVLVDEADLEEDTVDNVLQVLKAEFED